MLGELLCFIGQHKPIRRIVTQKGSDISCWIFECDRCTERAYDGAELRISRVELVIWVIIAFAVLMIVAQVIRAGANGSLY